MGVRPREPERTHRRPAGTVRSLGPRRGLGRHPHREVVPLDPGVRGLEVQVLRDPVVAEGEQHLHQARDAGRRLQVPDVRLHRAEEQRTLRIPARAVRRRRGPHLDRVPEFRSRSVRLQIVHRLGGDPGAGERLPDHFLLRRAVRDREARARPVLVHRRTEQHAEDPVAVALRVRQTLQHDHPAALTPHVAVGRRVERLAAPVGRQHSGILERRGHLARQDRVDAAREREIRFAPQKSRRRLVDRHQRRRAGGVHRDGRPLQPERERHPADGGGETGAGGPIDVRGRLAGRRPDQLPVVGSRNPGVDAGAAALEALRVQPGILERLPTHLQQEPLLGIEQFGLHRGDPEELRVEPVESGQVRPPGGLGAARNGEQQIVGPSPAYGVGARLELRPEFLRGRSSGETARHPHHRDPLLLAGDHLR